MSLTKRLVDMMHGEVLVESQYGEGSTFTAIIPQKVICEDGIGDMKQIFENYELSVGAMMPVPQFAGAHILVVDDMEMNRIVAKRDAAADWCNRGCGRQWRRRADSDERAAL